MNRNSSAVIIACLAIIILAGSVRATSPIEPFEFPDPIAGTLDYTAQLSYLPRSKQGFRYTPRGVPYPFISSSENLSASVRAEYHLSESTSVFGSGGWGVALVNTMIGDLEKVVREAEHATRFSAGLSYRRAFSSGHERKLLCWVDNQETLWARVAWNYISDPVVLSGSVRCGKPLTGSETRVGFGWGAGFLANRKIDMQISITHWPLLGNMGEPRSDVSFRVGFTPGPESKYSLAVKSDACFYPDDFLLALGIEWRVRGL